MVTLLYKTKIRKDFANTVFAKITSIKNGWDRFAVYLKVSNTSKKYSIVKYALGNAVYLSDKVVDASSLLSGDNLRFFISPFYSDNQRFAYLSTEWRHVGGNNLDISRLQEFVNTEYSDLFKIEIENSEFRLLQVAEHIEYEVRKPIIALPVDISYQKILYGPPGTGKSTQIKKMIEEHGFEAMRTIFHPDSDYHSFVGGYKPCVKKDENQKEYISYDFVPQVFIKAYTDACHNPAKAVLLVIEELNRGNCAQIFGDIFQCLDRNHTGHSDYTIDVDTDLSNYLRSQGLPPQLSLPPNLYIYATMNTSDQSLFPMDSAFKRRWDWQYVPIDYAKASEMKIEIGDNYYDWGHFINAANTSIKAVTESEDKQMGNFFVKADKPNGVISLEAFKSKVLFYLWSEVYKNQVKTGETIFQYKTDNDKVEEFSFSELFEQEQDIQILPSFMAKLEVEPLP